MEPGFFLLEWEVTDNQGEETIVICVVMKESETSV